MRLAVLLSLSMGGAALAGGYYLYQQLIVQFHHTKALEENAAVSLKEPVARINQLEQRQQQIAQLEAELGRLTTDQIALERRLANLAQKTPDDWLIAEADYLVRMAGRKLWLEQDPATALSLLKAADERIAAMQDTALLPLRKALAADIVQVGAIRSIDIASNVYALDEIMLQLDALKPGRSQNSYQPVRDENLSSSIDDWQSNLAKSWKALVNDFITVRHRASDITPLLSPQQEWYLKENIRAKLLQAQLALYRHDEASFGEAITMANGWVKQYFSLEQGSGGSISSHLDKLSALRIDAVPVSKFRASDLLRALIQDGVLQDGVMQDGVMPSPHAGEAQEQPLEQEGAQAPNPNEPSPNERNPDESGAEAPTPAEQESSEPVPVTQEPGEQEPGNQEPGLTPQPSPEANAASQEMRL
ncbi:uroporphyrinogen-III C-methyltransferase [Shewanella sp. JM162201]|uniref:Uroporphyrinogen-III C-methyltransferase n=1 Tax=Shewanella jiangmenensis TaxID=2837387 RepID=A0ABS5V7W9_9GAMM|nr:uroporphyrinogen-III C-methyltransferase [Shewanella jiangmenensis]MBT1446545.1 uroporphyrinogen-III C-methyltransferase [Shewanella jiangmenensis]